VKAISDTVEHLVTRPLSARPRNSIWRQAKEWSLMEFIFYIFYCCFLTFFFFLVGIIYILNARYLTLYLKKDFMTEFFSNIVYIKTCMSVCFSEFNSLNYALKVKNRIGQDKKFLTLNFCYYSFTFNFENCN
jgi:magnesium-transporting ATPase (P-type)